jgi:cytochrome c-type biogenesis protein
MVEGLNPLLAFAAGALTILSPCVLPLVPIVLGSAASRSKWGPAVLSCGLVLSFTLVGFTLASLGAGSAFDSELVRQFGAFVLMLAGILLLFPNLSSVGFLSRLMTPLANWANAQSANLQTSGLLGQAGIGVLLGLVWSPCVGPTLGAATILAAQGKNLAQVAIVMAAFGFGIASILLLLATATRGFLARWRGKMMSAGNTGKRLLGAVLAGVGLMIMTGIDHQIEGVLVYISPEWLTDLTTRF